MEIRDFSEHELAHFHDAVLHATGKSLGRYALGELFRSLPDHIIEGAYDWGMNDTLWRDHLIEHLQANPNLV